MAESYLPPLYSVAGILLGHCGDRVVVPQNIIHEILSGAVPARALAAGIDGAAVLALDQDIKIKAFITEIIGDSPDIPGIGLTAITRSSTSITPC